MFKRKARLHIWLRLLATELMVAASLFAPFQAVTAHAAASDSITLTVGVIDSSPPKPVTDLDAATNGTEGLVLLTWTAPSADSYASPSPTGVIQYMVRASSVSASAVGSTTTWWNTATQLSGTPAPPQLPGRPESMLMTNLEPGATLFFGLESLDNQANQSAIDDHSVPPAVQARAVVTDIAPPAPSSAVATSQNQSQALVGWNAVSAGDLWTYKVYVATFPSPKTNPLQVITVSSTSLSTTVSGLTAGTQYFFVVTAVDKGAPTYAGYALESAVSNVATASPGLNSPNAPTLSVNLAQLTTTQIGWTLLDNATNETDLYITNSNIGFGTGRITTNLGPLPSSGTSVGYIETGFAPNSPAARYGEAFNFAGSSFSAVVRRYTLANPPSNTQVTSVSTTSLVMAWNKNGNTDPTLYEIEYATDSLFTTPVSAGSSALNSALVAGLRPGTQYWLHVRARNGDNVATNFDVTVTTKTIPADNLSPNAPAGVWAEWQQLSPQAKLTIHWKPVTKNTDGTVFDDPAAERYKIYRSQTLAMGAGNPAPTTTTTDGLTWSDTLNQTDKFYYRVRAVDSVGNESPDSMIIEATGDGVDLNALAVSDDARSRIVFPAGNLAKALVKENNDYGDDLILKGVRVPEEEKGRIITSVRFEVYKASTGELVKNYMFKPAEAQVRLAYDVQGGQIIQKAPGQTTGSPVLQALQAKDQLALFWNNGVEWSKIGGTVDTPSQEIALKTGRLGRYQLRQAIRLGAVSLTRVYPRVFTPNDDGWNDKVIFEFDNPGLVPLKGSVFDVTGAKVADLSAGPNPDSSMQWDGKRNGQVVPGGIYIYQIEVGGATATGTIVVAQ